MKIQENNWYEIESSFISGFILGFVSEVNEKEITLSKAVVRSYKNRNNTFNRFHQALEPDFKIAVEEITNVEAPDPFNVTSYFPDADILESPFEEVILTEEQERERSIGLTELFQRCSIII